jgi:aconitate decarboxylase
MVTRELCERIVGLRGGGLGPQATASAARLVLDGLAVGVAGSREPAVRMLAEHHAALGSAPMATLLGLGGRLATVPAAAVNGAAMHVLDFEPMWSPANHALSTTLPVALALAEVLDVDGARLLEALVHGIELQGWLRQASHQWEARQLRFHPPGLVGPLGAAVTAAQLLGLGVGELRHALGIAASRCGGLMANVGTMTKATHCGHAAASGLEAALLAGRGFTANPDVLEAARGFGDTFAPEFTPEELAGFGPPYRLVDPGFALKLFPSQYGTHFGITAALSLHRAIPDVGAVRSVRLTVPLMDYVDRGRPTSGLDGKFSLQYTVAAALLDGRVDLATFSDERVAAADVADLLGRIELVPSAGIPARFEEMHVLVEVELSDGTTLRARCDGPPGSWRSGPVAPADHLRKVTDCLGAVLDPPTVATVVGLANRIEGLTAAELRRLVRLTGAAG